ncbi:lipolytic enzyme, G-D-S-L family protein [Psychromonas ingrahamii 37]|uniref:Lipolytic enzyme, G-D-S-L family protein n=1 Tax=Psychromonas ingrahamii (strain DSM 17664 / CCUG 51855 / 37) TaxID=357804 RepID=A1SVH6_PSYIN|nr:SGNH/GDSL hydrolase family protein [Psychromonas ingrahamii]ABM03491.1 lipolytic enzyme, G-D-S-L family protein [Psychromonas ingrahamii 37]
MILIKYFRTICILFLFSLSILVTGESVARQKPYDSIVVFGTSLSDTGNAFILLSDPSRFGFDESCGLGTPVNVPPYDKLDDLLVPDGSYAKGGHHVSNGGTWIEEMARSKGLAGSVRPTLRNDGLKARNYAVGGARAWPREGDFPCRFNLSDQLNAYLVDFATASADTLFVLEFGANDVRDALGSPVPLVVIERAIFEIYNTIEELYSRGARQFLLMNVPDIGQTPAVQILDGSFPDLDLAVAATYLTNAFNVALQDLQENLNSFPNIDVRIFDANALLNKIIANPDDYGIEVTDVPCVTPNVPPYKCKKPDTYLFWDGIHPTKAVHKIMALEAAGVLYTP